MNFLKFDKTKDFPFYKHNPKIPKIGWFILLLMIPIAFFTESLCYLVNITLLGDILFCFLLLIPLLFFSKWDYSLMFKKLNKNEIILAFLMFAGYMIYAICVGSILDYFDLSGVQQSAESMGITLESTIGLIFSMMGEELIKFIPLMFFMRIVYKYSQNRKLSISVSTIIVLIGFGLLHYTPHYSSLISVLALQGFGSIFEMYGYIKTKNIFVPYISHLLTDALIFIITLIGFA